MAKAQPYPVIVFNSKQKLQSHPASLKERHGRRTEITEQKLQGGDPQTTPKYMILLCRS